MAFLFLRACVCDVLEVRVCYLTHYMSYILYFSPTRFIILLAESKILILILKLKILMLLRQVIQHIYEGSFQVMCVCQHFI